MSLKAKLEAVIYAAEEPVTLAQLAVLFAEDALEWKAEQETARVEAEAAAADADERDALPLLAEESFFAEAEKAEPAVESAAEPSSEQPTEPSAETPAETSSTEQSVEEGAPVEATGELVAEQASEAEAADQPVAEPDPVAEEKRLAKQRDREVRAILRQQLDELVAEYVADARGIEIREIAGGYRMATKPECHDAVRLFVKSLKPALKLSLPALETLAVIAYKQPITAPEVNEIRGVDSSGVFGSLLARKLIATAGRKQVIGRPILYKTTKEFLLRFGLKDVTELPSMEEFEKMAAIELEESEPAGEVEAAAVAAAEAAADLDEAVREEPEGEAVAQESEPAEEEMATEAASGDRSEKDEGNAGDQTATTTEEAEPDEPPTE